MSIEETLKVALEKAKYNLQKYDNLLPVILLIKDTKPCGVVPVTYKNEGEKYQYAYAAGLLCRKSGFDGVVFVNYAALRMIPEHQREYVCNNMDTESPLTYSEGLVRKECIIVFYCSVEDTSKMLVQVYKREEDKIVFTGQIDEMSGVEGAFQDYFQKGCEAVE